MKPVFKCDYCSKMGTEEEIREHEPKCMENYDRKSCHTCTHKKFNYISDTKDITYECKIGKEVPNGCIIEFCPRYERKEIPNDLFGLFKGVF